MEDKLQKIADLMNNDEPVVNGLLRTLARFTMEIHLLEQEVQWWDNRLKSLPKPKNRTHAEKQYATYYRKEMKKVQEALDRKRELQNRMIEHLISGKWKEAE